MNRKTFDRISKTNQQILIEAKAMDKVRAILRGIGATYSNINEYAPITIQMENEVLVRNPETPIKGKSGIYGYFDKALGKYVYIGKDSNILANTRHKDHMHGNGQQIDRILKANPDRYEYHIIETINNGSLLDLDTTERHYIDYFGTYRYETGFGYNFTRGGETSYGIETKVQNIPRKVSVLRKHPTTKHITKRTSKGGKGTYYVSTNGTFSDGTYRICLNTPNCPHEKQVVTVKEVFDYFYENYSDKELKATKAFERNIGNFDELHQKYLEGTLNNETFNKNN